MLLSSTFFLNAPLKKLLLIVFLLFIGTFGQSQNILEEQSFEFLSDYLDQHKSTDSLYFDYVKAYENKAQQTGNLEKIFYIKSKYIVHSLKFEERLQHAQQCLEIATKQNNTRYTGLAYNLISFVYYIERDLEKSLHYELLAEELLAKTNDLYNLNKSRFGIGTMYYFLGDYEKALTFFNQTADYYQQKKSYNDLNGYISSLEYKAKNYMALKQFTMADKILDTIAFEMKDLKAHHFEIENAYFSLLKAQNLYSQHQYKTSLTYLQKTLPVIIKNDDFANEHLVYLYLGKNLWILNQRDKAVEEFKKIDVLYTAKQYSDLNLLEAYNYLIAFYKNNNDLNHQLFYTERLLHITNDLQTKNKGLNNVLHTKYETKKLEASKKALQKELKRQKLKEYFTYALGLITIIAFIGYVIFNRKKQKQLRKQYDYFVSKQLLTELNTDHILVLKHDILDDSNKASEDILGNTKTQNVLKRTLSDEKIQEISQKLIEFEKQHAFVNQNISLNSLAKDFNTNSKYLSEVINFVKQENFASYINTLRINYAIKQLHEDKQLHKLTMNALAEKFGFNNARSFSEAFFKVTQLKPSYYISQIKKDDETSS